MVNTQVRTQLPFQVSKTHLHLQDKDLNLNDITAYRNKTIFRLKELPIRPQERDLNVQTEIRIELAFDINEISRDSYKFVDFLSDIGGMNGMLISGSLLFLSMWNFNNFDNTIVSRLYKIEEPSDNEDMSTNELKPSKISNIQDFCFSKIPEKM